MTFPAWRFHYPAPKFCLYIVQRFHSSAWFEVINLRFWFRVWKALLEFRERVSQISSPRMTGDLLILIAVLVMNVIEKRHSHYAARVVYRLVRAMELDQAVLQVLKLRNRDGFGQKPVGVNALARLDPDTWHPRGLIVEKIVLLDYWPVVYLAEDRVDSRNIRVLFSTRVDDKIDPLRSVYLA